MEKSLEEKYAELEIEKERLEAEVKEQTKAVKRVERVLKVAERKQNQLLQEVDRQKKFVQTILDSQGQLLIITDGENLQGANLTFCDFYGVDSYEDFHKKYDFSCISKTFSNLAPSHYLQDMEKDKWLDFVIDNPNETHKAMISINDQDRIFSVTASNLPGDNNLKTASFSEITEVENARKRIEEIHKHTRDSIEYASLIQSALIPESLDFAEFFDDYFALWNPKDIVGGDIYLFEKIRENEMLLMVIDCTGHGVPGAFVTMLVKAIERQVISEIANKPDIEISPAWILGYFNKEIKNLLKQHDKTAISNAGFDGGIIYYNKHTNILKFAGAETPFFVEQDNKLKVFKTDRHSVGYRSSNFNYKFTDYQLDVSEKTTIYLSTDGFLDQNGGEKGFPFGKKRFKNLLSTVIDKPFILQEQILRKELLDYQQEEDRNDDITVVGFTIG